MADEIENALSYYQATFLRGSRRSTPTWKPSWANIPCTAFCAWANGLAATATATPTSQRKRCSTRWRRQSDVALRHYLTEVHYLGGELSLSARLVRVSPRMEGLASARPTPEPASRGRAYRRALTGIYARLAASLKDLTGGDRPARHRGTQNAYASAEGEFWPICV